MSTRPAASAADAVQAAPADEQGIISIADGNIKKKILKAGHGPTPTDRSDVTVHYTGRLLDGTVFDSSKTRNEPFVFKIGQGQVIKGWDQGVATMKVGETAILTCSPEFAYGARGSPPKIPANATLEFEVELLSFDNTSNVTEDKGVKKSVQQAGSGHNRPNDNATVKLKYSGRVKDSDKKFVDRSSEVQTIVLGSDPSLVWGLEEGIKNMHAGERSTIFVSPQYGYGSAGNKDLGIAANAALEFDVELVEFTRGVDPSTLDFPAKLAYMEGVKNHGNAIFKAGVSLDRAQKVYAKAMAVFPYIESLDDAQKAAVHAVQLACISNVVITKMKQGDLDEVIKQATVGLAINPKHVKLLYNRALAYLKQGLLPEGEADLKTAAAADPANADVARELKGVKARVKAIADKEKKAFGGFFGRVKLVSDEEERAAKEAAAKAQKEQEAKDEDNMSDEDEDDVPEAAAAAAAPAAAPAAAADAAAAPAADQPAA